MERVVFDISWDGLAYTKSPRVRLTWFKKLLCISSLFFGWVAFEIVFFFFLPSLALISWNLIYSSSMCSISPNLFLNTWISFTQYFVIFSASSRQKSKSVVCELNTGAVQSSRSHVLFIFKLCDLPSLWSCLMTRIAACFLSQDQVYRGGHCQTGSSALALLKPRLRGQMLNTSNPILVWQDLNGSDPVSL